MILPKVANLVKSKLTFYYIINFYQGTDFEKLPLFYDSRRNTQQRSDNNMC